MQNNYIHLKNTIYHVIMIIYHNAYHNQINNKYSCNCNEHQTLLSNHYCIYNYRWNMDMGSQCISHGLNICRHTLTKLDLSAESFCRNRTRPTSKTDSPFVTYWLSVNRKLCVLTFDIFCWYALLFICFLWELHNVY